MPTSPCALGATERQRRCSAWRERCMQPRSLADDAQSCHRSKRRCRPPSSPGSRPRPSFHQCQRATPEQDAPAGSPPGRLPSTLVSLLDDDLPVHPGMRCADVEVITGLREGERLRLALLQYARIPFADLPPLEGGSGMRGITDIGEGQRRAGFDLGTTREKDILHIVGADLDLVDVISERAGRSGNLLLRGWRPQRTQLSLQ